MLKMTSFSALNNIDLQYRVVVKRLECVEKKVVLLVKQGVSEV